MSDDNVISKCTSYSDLYVIDEAEETRLKKIALARFIADEQRKALQEQQELIDLKR
jgi:hypothetical protein